MKRRRLTIPMALLLAIVSTSVTTSHKQDGPVNVKKNHFHFHLTNFQHEKKENLMNRNMNRGFCTLPMCIGDGYQYYMAGVLKKPNCCDITGKTTCQKTQGCRWTMPCVHCESLEKSCPGKINCKEQRERDWAMQEQMYPKQI